MHIKDKVVAVTGGARGIGKAIATAFAERDARIALVDLAPSDLESARAELAARGADVRVYAANVAKEDQVIAALDQAVADFGRLDVMVNNAGIIKDGLLVKVKDGAVVGKMGLDQWQAVIDVNLTGVFLCGREAAERMIKLGHGGVIINIASISKAGNPGQSNYSAAKAGVTAMAVVWARELARFGIRAASIAPGFTRTDLLAGMPPEMLDKVTAPVPLKRLGLPEEIAQAAVFIAENDYFNGRSIDIDGGLRL
ncbi:MAG: family oxidoreductase [Pseudomonadota bacterium]|jgi:3-oxoacyl-[acyl-carrier protein] reductase|nr:family oxidoreductase [Pseudomonadota bacterium]MDQ1310214.1 family oxidoreductase [Pseudomonadota bacterium]MDQ1345122.1 family oxidoreductase [Pseudomonadota bacterium]